MNLVETMKIIAVLQVLYPGWSPREGTGEGWQEILSDVDYNAVNAAIKDLTGSRTSDFPPSIGAIKVRSLELTGGASNEHAEWDALYKKIRNVGSYGSPKLSPINEMIVRRLGGWKTVCASDLDDLQRNYHYQYEDAAHQVHIETERARIAALEAGQTSNDLTLTEGDVTT